MISSSRDGMRPRSSRRAPAILLGLALACGPSRAAEGREPRHSLIHRVGRGETVEQIATRYYGDAGESLFLREANHLGPTLAPGQRLWIPTAIEHRVRRGETLASVARRLLGDARRARFLAEWNGLRDGQPLPVGTSLVVPFHLEHRARAPESLASLAKAFYGDASQGQLLAAYNFRDKPLLATGERLIVPVPHVRLSPSLSAGAPRLRAKGRARSDLARSRPTPTPPTASPSPIAPATAPSPPVATAAATDATRAAPAHAAAAGDRPSVTLATVAIAASDAGPVRESLRRAERAYRDGSYEDAQAQLQALAGRTLERGDRLAVEELLAFVGVALGDEAEAARHFREVLAIDPDHALDPAAVSPKIRAAFERARGPK